MDRRVVRVSISYALLSEVLKYRGVKPGERITSSLPDDAEVTGVTNDHERAGCFIATLHSDFFPPIADDEVPPLLDVVFTRHRVAIVKEKAK